jgi:hypothetical protein
VNFVVAVLHGAPVATFDLDVVHSRDSANIRRLLAALRVLEARYRVTGHRNRSPDESHLASPRHQLRLTRYGPLDLLDSIGAGRDYQALFAHTVRIRIGTRLTVRLLDLPTLIEIKQEMAGEKDKAILPILLRTLQEKQRR